MYEKVSIMLAYARVLMATHYAQTYASIIRQCLVVAMVGPHLRSSVPHFLALLAKLHNIGSVATDYCS